MCSCLYFLTCLERMWQKTKEEQGSKEDDRDGERPSGCNNTSSCIFLCCKHQLITSLLIYRTFPLHISLPTSLHSVHFYIFCKLAWNVLRVSSLGPGLFMMYWTAQQPTQIQTKAKLNTRKTKPKIRSA